MIPGSEFAISRTASKDNSSSYHIIRDGVTKKVQFKEIAKLLESHGIDLRYNRFLILQGEVEQIALMKPKAENENDMGMLEFLEDIIGSNRLKVPLSKLQERVEQMNVLRAEKLNRVKVIESEKMALEGPRNEAIRFIQMENQIVRNKNTLFQLYRQESEQARSAAEHKFKQAEAVYQQAMVEIEKLQQSRAVLEAEVAEKESAHSQHQKEYEACKKAFEKLELRDVQARDQIKHTKAKGKNLEKDLEQEREKREGLLSQPDVLQAEIEQLMGKKAEVESAKAEADAELESVMGQIREDTSAYQSQKEKLEQELLSMAKGLSAARSAKELAEKEYDLMLSREKTAKAKLEQLRYKLESAKREVNDKKNALSQFTASLPDMEKEKQSLIREMDEKKHQKDLLTDEVRALKSKESEAKSKKTSAQSRGRILDALLKEQEKEKGKPVIERKVTGICGRLGDLGTIDRKYDVAISTACGRLDQIVVETIEDAMKAVRFLKEKKLGIMTFIALNKIANHNGAWNRSNPAPGNCPRLFDLVQTDPKYLTAFWFALFDTIVVDDWDQGMRISKQRRIRIVTLTGGMFETSGAMSGGGRASQGRMRLAARASTSGRQSVGGGGEMSEEQLRELTLEIENKTSLMREIEERVQSITSQLETRSQELSVMRANAPKLQMEVDAKEANLSGLKDMIAEAERSVKEVAEEFDAKRLKELEKKVASASEDYESVEREAAKVQDQVDSINAAIKEVVDKRLGQSKAKVSKLKKEVDSIESEISKKSATKKATERNISKSEQKIDTLQKDLQSSIKLISELKEEMKRLEEEGGEITNRYQESKQQQKGMVEELVGIRKQIEACKAEETALASQNLDAKHEADKLSSVLAEKETDVKRWTDKIKGLELQRIPDEEDEEEIEVEEDVVPAEKQQDDHKPEEIIKDEDPVEASSKPQEQQQPPAGEGSQNDAGDHLCSSPSASNAAAADAHTNAPAASSSKSTHRRVVRPVNRLQLKTLSPEELSDLQIAVVKSEIEKLEQSLKNMKPNMAAIAEYKKKVEIYLTRFQELSETTAKRDMFKTQYEQLRSQRMQEFKQGFLIITRKLKEMYRMITSGGDAELEWADSLDPFSEGINFSVRPNKKAWKRISNLSGGEKTLSSLSLIFALHYFKPSPLYVMDEIDAALDFKNVSIVANYIRERTRNTQFIIISLRNNMYEMANRLVGIYKTHNCTKSIAFIHSDWKDLPSS